MQVGADSKIQRKLRMGREERDRKVFISSHLKQQGHALVSLYTLHIHTVCTYIGTQKYKRTCLNTQNVQTHKCTITSLLHSLSLSVLIMKDMVNSPCPALVFPATVMV